MTNKHVPLLGIPAPVLLIGTYDKDGKADVMTAAYGGICGGDPHCIMIAIRKVRCTYENIMETGDFTVNFPSSAQVTETDYFGMVSGHKADKLAVSGVKARRSKSVNAPLLPDCPVIYECKLVNNIDMGGHAMLIGEIRGAVQKDPQTKTIKDYDVMVYDLVNDIYYGIGNMVGHGFQEGREILNK